MALHHRTLNTGHVANTPRADAAQPVIDQLLPLVDAGGGPVPGLPGWHVAVIRSPDQPGAAFFQLAQAPGLTRTPAVMAVACWRRPDHRVAWEQAVLGYRALHGPLSSLGLWHPPPPSPPPALPWLAVWLTPHLATIDPADLAALGDLERCVAWALAEGNV